MTTDAIELDTGHRSLVVGVPDADGFASAAAGNADLDLASPFAPTHRATEETVVRGPDAREWNGQAPSRA